MAENLHLDLVPPLVESGKAAELKHSGRSLSVSQSPLANSLAVYLSPLNDAKTVNHAVDEQPVYFVTTDSIPSSERRLFVTDTLIIFAAFQNLLDTSKIQPPNWLQSNQSIEMMRKLSIDYVNFIKECWVHSSQPVPRLDGPLQFNSEHYRCLYTSFSLFVVLFLPEPGYEDAPVGDELMEWLNIHFIEPSTEEGDHLSSLEQPWEDESFWPYLTRTTLRGLTKASQFFLDVLTRHPSEDLQDLSQTLKTLLVTQPRLQDFTAERDFAYASRRWNDKVKALRIEMNRIPEESRTDDFENWWDRLSDIVGILEGRPEIVKRVCEELGADWKEVVAAWGVFIDTRLRRQDLPDVLSQVLEDMPPDPTILEDLLHADLLSLEPTRALKHASDLDPWLAAHLGDVMAPLGLLDPSEDDESDVSVRDHYILAYAEYLHSDPGLWRITVDYMYSCGDVGKGRADEVLIRVPLRLNQQAADSGLDAKIRSGDVVGVLKEVNEACFQYKREAVRRTVCRIAAQALVSNKDYGLAVAYCTSAEDWTGLGHVVDRVLDEYILSGPTRFAEYASAFAPSVADLRSQQPGQGVFVHRLMFAVRYAHFHELCRNEEYWDAASDLVVMFQDDIAPKSWWAVLLCDSLKLLQYDGTLLFSTAGVTELLRKLDEITVRTSQGSGGDYLAVLARTIKGGGEKEALERLKIVRLALARYFARRCIVRE